METNWRDQEPTITSITLDWDGGAWDTWEGWDASDFTDAQIIPLIHLGVFGAEDVGMTSVEWRKALRSRATTWGGFLDLVSSRRAAHRAKSSAVTA